MWLQNLMLSRRPRSQSEGRDPSSDFWYGAAPRLNAAEVNVTVERALQLPVVYASLQALSQSISGLPFGLFRYGADDSRTAVDAHPVIRMLRKPNPDNTEVEFFGQMVFDLASEGDAIIERRGDQLWRLAPSSVDVQRLPDGGRRYLVRQVNGSTRTLLEDEVWHLKVFPHVQDGLRGLSPIRAGQEAIAAAIALQDFSGRFFANDCTPPFVLEHPTHFTDKESKTNFLEAIKRWWGGSRRHSPGVLEYGIKLQKVGINNDEAQFLDTRNAADHALARIWRMPPHKVGLLDRSTNNNIEQQALEFVTDTLLPWLRLIERSVVKNLLGPEAESLTFEFNVAGLLRGDLRTRYQAFALGRQWGWFSINDIRRLENMNPIDGGDDYLSPMNMVPAGSVSVVPEQPSGGQAAKRLVFGPSGEVVSEVTGPNVYRLEDYRNAA